MPLEETIDAKTKNPEMHIGLFDKIGSIEINKNADLILLNKDFKIKNVYLN